MIELPEDIHPNQANPRMIDFGFTQESAGGAAIRIDRPGNRYEVDLSFPVLTAEQARLLVSRLTRAKSEGLRVPYPLQWVSQGNPGSPVVDGSASAGRVLNLRDLAVGHAVREGYWLNVIGADGTRYLHCVTEPALIGADGLATLAVEPPLRAIPADGWEVELAVPVIEGLITSDIGWTLSPGGFASGISVTVREAA